MIRETVEAFMACIVSLVLCAFAYPALVYVFGHTLFPSQAEGSLLVRDGKTIGSRLIAQPFTSDQYFSPRPSAAGPNGYAADAASGSNLGTNNPALRDRIALDAANKIARKTGDADLKEKLGRLDTLQAELKAKSELAEKTKADEEAITKLTESVSAAQAAVNDRASELGKDPEALVPVDLVTASGGGLDPDISPEAARYQAARVASARRVPLDRVRKLIADHINRSGAIIGAPPRVNVLELNLALDEEMPVSGTSDASSPAAPTAAEPATTAPAPPAGGQPSEATPSAKDSASSTAVEALSERIARLQEKLDAVPVQTLAADVQHLKAQLAQRDEAPATNHKQIDERIEGLGRDFHLFRAELMAKREASKGDDAVASLDKKLQAVQSELETLRTSMKQQAETPERPAARAKPPLDLAPAIELYRAKKYAAATATFLAFTESNPEDARTWYFAALANGFATNQWTGRTVELVTKGLECERAGSPSAAEIDATFADLTRQNGREWLAFYRKQINER